MGLISGETFRLDIMPERFDIAKLKGLSANQTSFVLDMVEHLVPFIKYFGVEGTLYSDVYLDGEQLSFMYCFKTSASKALEYQKFFESVGIMLSSEFPKGFSYEFENACAFMENYAVGYLISKHPFRIMSHCSTRKKDGIFIIDTLLRVPIEELENSHESRPSQRNR